MAESAFAVNVPEAEPYVRDLRDRLDAGGEARARAGFAVPPYGAKADDAANEDAAGILARTLPREGIQAECREVVLIENSAGLWKPMCAFPLSLGLRPALDADLNFAMEVEAQTMRDFAVATFGRWSPELVRDRAKANLLAGRTMIIELDRARAGIQVVERTAEHVRLLQLFILPRYQRRGIGSALVRRLIAEAGQARVPLKLRFLKVNPVQAFYARLGLRAVSATAQHVYMEHGGNA